MSQDLSRRNDGGPESLNYYNLIASGSGPHPSHPFHFTLLIYMYLKRNIYFPDTDADEEEERSRAGHFEHLTLL